MRQGPNTVLRSCVLGYFHSYARVVRVQTALGGSRYQMLVELLPEHIAHHLHCELHAVEARAPKLRPDGLEDLDDHPNFRTEPSTPIMILRNI